MTRVVQEIAYTDGGSLNELVDKANDFYRTVADGTNESKKDFEELAKTIDTSNKALAVSVKQGSAAATSAEDLEKANKRLADSYDRVNDSTRKTDRSLGGIGRRLKSTAQGFRDKGKAAASGAKSMLSARAAALASRAALGLLGAAAAAVGAAFSRSQKFVDTFNVVLAQGKAVLDVFVDRIANVGTVLASLFTGDISLREAGSQLLDTFKGVGDELEREVRLAGELERISQRIVRDEINLNIQRSAANARLKELNLLIEDTTKGFNERRAAAEEAAELEQRLLQREIELQEQKIATLLGETEITDQVRQRIELLRQEGFAFDEATASASEYATTLNDIGLSSSTIEDAQELAQLIERRNQLETTSLEVQTTNNNKLNVINDQAQAAFLKRQEERRKALEDLAAFQESLTQRLLQIEGSRLEGEERIQFERRLADEEINQLERVAREKFEAVNQEFSLEKEFAELRIALEEDTEKQISEFRLNEARERIAEEERIALAQLDIAEGTADQRLAIQRQSLIALRDVAEQEFGSGSSQFLQIEAQIAQLTRKRVEEDRSAALEQLETREQIALAQIELQRQSTEAELTLEQSKERAKTVALIRFAQERREILLNQFGEDSPEVQLIDLDIQRLQDAIDQIDNLNLDPLERIKLKIQQAFNLSDADVQLINEQIGGIADNILSGFDALRQARLSENERTIAAIDAQIEDLQSKLDIEELRERDGFANSAQALRDSLEEQNAAREEAERERLDIERRAARQRLIQESAQQVSALSLAAVRLLASEASRGIVGLILAASGIATIFSIAARAKAQAEEFSSAPEFREGGSIVNGLLVGPSHERGGIDAIYSDRKGQARMVNLEGDEFVVNKIQAAKHGPLLEAINTGAIEGMNQDGLRSLFSGLDLTGIDFNSGVQKIMGNGGREIILNNSASNDGELVSILSAALGGKLDELASREDFFSHDGKIYKVDRSGTVPRFKPVQT